jgi:hypothetical protein
VQGWGGASEKRKKGLVIYVDNPTPLIYHLGVVRIPLIKTVIFGTLYGMPTLKTLSVLINQNIIINHLIII